MTWNYRIVRHTGGDEPWFAIHEVYYDDEDAPTAVTTEPVCPGGDTPDEVIAALEQMLTDARTRPVIDFDAIPGQ
jgi:hypothetical protein